MKKNPNDIIKTNFKPKKDPKKKKRKKKKVILIKPLKAIKKNLWTLFSRYIRLSYSNKNGLCQCYTCGIVLPYKQLQAGHAITGRRNAILFEEQIVRPQCYQCNIHKHGLYQIFIPKLCIEIGIDKYQELEKYSKEVVFLDREWCENQIEIYKKKIDIMLSELE
jgi:hypothetical protein